MKRQELLARLLATALCLAVIGLPLYAWQQSTLIHASVAEHGDWNPETIHAQAGEPLVLAFTSDDVLHGFGVGQMEMEPVDIEPGKVSRTTLIFTTPGRYTFFCTRWCGLNHWRMRGTIEVSGDGLTPEPASAPLYVSLGINLDAPHPAAVLPTNRPNAQRGLALLDELALDRSAAYYRSRTPAQVFIELEPTQSTEAQRWDAVAALWLSNTTPAGLAEGRQLFARNCAACHGEGGGGDGVFADELAAAGQASLQSMNGAMEMAMQTPASFADPERLLGASPALLQGKILRGGMGTGMPMWGSIFREQQIWNLIAFLYSFQFEYPE